MTQMITLARPAPTRRGRGVGRRFAALLAGMTAATLMAAGATVAAEARSGAPAVAPLRITDVAPDGGTLGVPTDAAIFVDFDTRMNTDTVFQDIELRKKGSRKVLGVTDIYHFADDTWAGYPHRVLQPDTVYQVIVRGGRDGVRGENGSRLGGVDDPSARFKDGDVVFSFRTAG